MGADLCGYLLAGPLNLPQPDEGALNKLARDLAQLLWARNEQPGAPLNDGVDSWAQAAHSMGYDADGLESFFDYGDGTIAEDADTVEEAEQKLREVLDQLVDDVRGAWSGLYRDLAWRTVELSGEKHRLLFAGGSTWGDGPAQGSAWYLFEQAAYCGLLDLFPIR